MVKRSIEITIRRKLYNQAQKPIGASQMASDFLEGPLSLAALPGRAQQDRENGLA